MSTYLYISTHGRVGVWLLGLILGYHLQNVKGETINLSKKFLIVGWTLAVLIQLITILSFYIFMTYGNYIHPTIHSIYNGFHRTVFAISICWIIYVCEVGYGGPVHTILSWWPFQIFGKITFVLYISHVGLMYAMHSSAIGSHQYNMTRMFRDLVGDIACCILVSIILSLLVEVPFISICRIFVESRKNSAVEPSLSITTGNGTKNETENKGAGENIAFQQVTRYVVRSDNTV